MTDYPGIVTGGHPPVRKWTTGCYRSRTRSRTGGHFGGRIRAESRPQPPGAGSELVGRQRMQELVPPDHRVQLGPTAMAAIVNEEANEHAGIAWRWQRRFLKMSRGDVFLVIVARCRRHALGHADGVDGLVADPLPDQPPAPSGVEVAVCGGKQPLSLGLDGLDPGFRIGVVFRFGGL